MNNKIRGSLLLVLLTIFVLLVLFVIYNLPLNDAKTKSIDCSEPSNILISNPSPQQIENLDILAKIWGMMKYYHPRIRRGAYNWDVELFTIMPSIIQAKNRNERDNILIKWIEKFGELPTKRYIQKEDTSQIKMNPDFAWIEDSNILGSKLSSLLLNLKNVKMDSMSYYVSLHPLTQNSNFERENLYTNISYSDVGFRLLALFRYWNVIQYYYPYRYLIGENWNNVLGEFIPQFIDAKNEIEYLRIIQKLITRINDSHACIMQNKILDSCKGDYFTFADILFIDGKAIVNNTFDNISQETNCLQKGDIILKIDNKTIVEYINELTLISPASNETVRIRDILQSLFFSKDSILDVELERNGIRLKKEIRCYNKRDVTIQEIISKIPSWDILKDSIGYLYIGTLSKDSVSIVMDYLWNTKGIVIDLRCYPSDDILYEIGKFLMSKPTAFVKPSNASIVQPGEFRFGDAIQIGNMYSRYYLGKVAILINENTQSAAEFNAMAFRVAPKAKLFGSPTAGADGNISIIMLPGGIKTSFSGIGIYYPDGTETQRIGIAPDVMVKPTIKGIQEGRDEVLEKAVQWLNTK